MNGDGIPDGMQMRSPYDMNGDGIPDGMQMHMRNPHDMNGDGIPDAMQMHRRNPHDRNGDGIPDAMQNPCHPCLQCPMHTHDGGKCKASLSDCDYNGFFGEMMEHAD